MPCREKIAAYQADMEYLTAYKRRRNVPAPQPIKLQAGTQPHDLVARLNRGSLPYRETGKTRSRFSIVNDMSCKGILLFEALEKKASGRGIPPEDHIV